MAVFPALSQSLKTQLTINGDNIAILHQSNIDQLPWAALNVDVVLECSGTFSDRETAEQHIVSGAKRVLFSQPAEPTVDATIVYGVNQHLLTGDETIISQRLLLNQLCGASNQSAT